MSRDTEKGDDLPIRARICVSSSHSLPVSHLLSASISIPYVFLFARKSLSQAHRVFKYPFWIPFEPRALFVQKFPQFLFLFSNSAECQYAFSGYPRLRSGCFALWLAGGVRLRPFCRQWKKKWRQRSTLLGHTRRQIDRYEWASEWMRERESKTLQTRTKRLTSAGSCSCTLVF